MRRLLIIDLLTGLNSLRGHKFTDIAVVQANAQQEEVESLLQREIPSWHNTLGILDQELHPFAFHIHIINICMRVLPLVLLAAMSTIGLLWLQGNPWGSLPSSSITLAVGSFLVSLYLYRFAVEERGVKRRLQNIEKGSPHWRQEISSALEVLINVLMGEEIKEQSSPSTIRLLLTHCDYRCLEMMRKPDVFEYYNFEAYLNPIMHPLAMYRKEAKIVIRRPERYVLHAIRAVNPDVTIQILTIEAIAKRLRLGPILAEMRQDGFHVRVRMCSIRDLLDTTFITEHGIWQKVAEGRSGTRPANFVHVQDPEQQAILTQSFSNA